MILLEKELMESKNKIRKLEDDNLFSSCKIVEIQSEMVDYMKKLNNNIVNKDEINLDRKEETKLLSKMVDTITMLSKKANNNVQINGGMKVTNNKMNLTFALDLSKENLQKQSLKITRDHVNRRHIGLTDWFIESVVSNEKGEKGLICTDPSRKNFQYLKFLITTSTFNFCLSGFLKYRHTHLIVCVDISKLYFNL